MATILLQAAGGALGGLVGGPLGAVAGRALGALGGYAIDSRLGGRTQRREGPRLGASRVLDADEGAGIARLYGTARIAGQVIWTTRFEEVSTTDRSGGKGGGGAARTETTTYSYFGNVAIGLCEGPVAGVRRIWADGEEMDLAGVNWRLHRGDERQQPDPLIEAKQGRGNAPAYRGLAYVVVERLALERWGNRIPNIACEVLRPVGELERAMRAVTVIPGATEHGLDPLTVRERLAPGHDRLINRNVLHGANDVTASIDELTALCPQLERAALVVSWFCDDLRVGHAGVWPGVETTIRDETVPWRVGGLARAEARTVSQVEGGPAYGGTPSDAGVVRSIQALAARGLKVTLYPFLLMDVPAGNALPDPYGGGGQAAYPWRGRMTLDLEPGQPGSLDGTAGVSAEIARFVGRAAPGDFAVEGGEVRYRGPSEWSYRRMVLHQAALARLAGGCDAFVIGSEMRGLTRLRDEAGRFPFVEALVSLARDVKAMLPRATVTYAADWSEYFGYQPDDGSGDVFFNLDPLWSDPAIDVVGIDNYLPLADWRDGDAEAGGRDAMTSPYDREGLAAAIAGGEGFDWYYASPQDRRSGRRTPVTDGLGESWVYRPKDLRGWWSHRHVERRGGVETGPSSAWVPRSKPIWFTELGCPAIDRGANQPNVFVDPKSAESAFPHFSAGARDDHAQRRFLEAHLAYWNPQAPGFRDADNPVSPVYGGRMVAADAIHLWCLDARPAPAFPERADLWRDGGNWERGHWLTGRLGRAPLDATLAQILDDHGVEAFDVSAVDGEIGGYLAGGLASVRSEIEDLLRLCGIEAWSEGGILRFRSVDRARPVTVIDAVVDDDERALIEIRRGEAGASADEMLLGFSDPARAYQPATADAVLGTAALPRQTTLELPVVMAEGEARQWAERLLRREGGEREVASFALAPTRLDLVPGDWIELPETTGCWQIERIEDGEARRIEARRRTPGGAPRRSPSEPTMPRAPAPVFASRPVVHFLDLPDLGVFPDGEGARFAVSAVPWLPYELLVSAGGSGFEARARAARPATVGRLAEPWGAGSQALLDRSHRLVVDLVSGGLSSAAELDLWGGANLAAVEGPGGAWEVIQFREAREIAPGRFAMTGLVRALGGTEDALAGGGARAGAGFVLLDGATGALPLKAADVGSERSWLVVPAGRALDDDAVVRRPAVLGMRRLRPLAPVHLAGRLSPAGLALRWIRRTRSTVEAWEGADVPLGEASETYRVTIGEGRSDALVVEAPAPKIVIDAQTLSERFGGLPERLTVAVSQISLTAGPGTAARIEVVRRP
ncbi:baseplate multidomain protein megatron [Aureimonas pseudogalii]|uniref:Host specificity protein n=1 Tax=Aureimonas pseudogalii TaxID=1744844 RepID=A0A7W6E8A7_9HYPH|nr:glycoside hydrolase/phage tail family protein [Aureimonas pseudogalii]MBB3996563.1 hypothetical protein [Aureimonas pseudogalii]